MSEDTRGKLNNAEKDYDDKFGRVSKSAGPTGHRADINESRQSLADSESSGQADSKKAIADTPAGKAALASASAAGPAGRIAAKILGRIRTKQGGAGVILAAVILMILGLGTLGTSLAPMAFFANVVDDLNDQLAALDIRQERMFRTKISYDDKKKAFKGCVKLSIRCKAKSMSARDIRYFKEAGIEVKGTTRTFAGVSRTFPDTYSYRGGPDMSPTELLDSMKSNRQLRLDFKKAVNMNYFGFADSRFKKWVNGKLGISQRKPTLTGDEAERSKQLASREKSTISAETKFVPAVDEEGKAILDSDGKPLFTIEGDTSGKTYSQAEVDTIKARFASLGGVDGIGKISSQTLKALSIVGAYDMACSVKNLIGSAAVAAKYATYYQLAQYVAPKWALADARKSADISAEDATALGNFFSQTDSRQFIDGITSDSTGDISPADLQYAQVKNPYYGKNVMDSPEYKLSAYGDIPRGSPESMRYSLGFGQSSLLLAVGASAATIEAFLNIGAGDSACQVVQNWAIRGIATVIGLIAAFFSGGGSIALNVAIMVAISAAFFAASAALAAALKNEVIPPDMDDKPNEKSAATWTGLSVILAESSQARGMVPGNAQQIAEYQTLAQASKQDYVAIESQRVSPFDISSPYSVAGRTAIAINQFRPDSLSAPDILKSVAKANSTSVAKLLGDSVSAVDYTERFNKCDDESYKEIGIDPDVQCNLRYIMTKEDLSRDTEEVMDYMENEYVEEDTTTGMPAGYTPPSPQEASSFVKGLADGFVASFYTSRDFVNEYGKFLDYCAFRAMPFGNTYEESSAFGSAGREWLTGENCMKPGLPYSAFRVYTMDVTLQAITDEVDYSDVSVGGSGAAASGTVSGDVKSLAQQILDLESSGKIIINNIAPQDAANRSLPKMQLEDMAAGKAPAAPTRCGFTVATPINPDPKLLQFLVNFGKEYKYQINSLFAQCHSETSLHYRGQAVDFGCPTNTTIADRIGAPFGIKHNSENCANDNHWHYSIGGR